MGVLQNLLDPTILFVIGCLASPVVLLYGSHPDQFMEGFLDYMKNPAMLAGFVTLIFGWMLGGKWRRGFSFGDQKLALWFLLNGAFIHVTMDGFAISETCFF
eukprot:TRINITY_DN1484_c0_g1_i1.p2 TRINITY_DN1484_c0_g1~~TRINITY_DN1484_c0_g1_i1.p2  ORF type:complete len:102 (+),score=11.87 TRINITY_DN1484_c0_g1_i1:42-347(+)